MRVTKENEFELVKERELSNDENPYDELMRFLDQEPNDFQVPELEKANKIDMSWPLVSV